MLSLRHGSVVAAQELTLPASLPLSAVPQRVYYAEDGREFTVPHVPEPPAGPGLDVTLGPMDIRTFVLSVV